MLIHKCHFGAHSRKIIPISWLFLTVVVASSSLSTFSNVVGLKNLGNTCYLNAQLQCAYHIPRVRSLILSPPSADCVAANPADEEEDTKREESVALIALRRLFSDIKASSGNIASPAVFCQSLGIPVLEQQDSQEFWKLLLPALKLPALTDLYQGAFEDYIVALDGSGRERRREEPFLDLSLDVAKGSIQSSLEQLFGEPELLSNAEGNGWRPEKGADKVDAHKGSLLRVQGLPSILQFHLKRFDFDWNTETMNKLNDPFHFPEKLDLSAVCKGISKDEEERAVYDLQAVIIHLGEYGSGHYYAYVRPDVRNDVWYRFNDEAVTEDLSFDEVFADAYGGRTAGVPSDDKRDLLSRIRRALQGGSYGYGGRTSNAYVLQYVRRSDISMLYEKD